MVTYYRKKYIATCSPMVWQFYDTLILASTNIKWLNDPSKSKFWKILETLNHLNLCKSLSHSTMGPMVNIIYTIFLITY